MGVFISGGLGVDEDSVDGGSATLPDGSNSVDVTHNLGTIPRLIVLTEQSDAALHIPSATSTTFTVNRGGVSTGAVDFYWHARR